MKITYPHDSVRRRTGHRFGSVLRDRFVDRFWDRFVGRFWDRFRDRFGGRSWDRFEKQDEVTK